MGIRNTKSTTAINGTLDYTADSTSSFNEKYVYSPGRNSKSKHIGNVLNMVQESTKASDEENSLQQVLRNHNTLRKTLKKTQVQTNKYIFFAR